MKHRSLKFGIDETEDNKTDRTITISRGSSDIKNIIENVVESEIQKLQKMVQSTLGVYSDEEWKEDINSESTFEVKVTIKIDQDIADDTIIVSLRSANNDEKLRVISY